MQNSGQRETTLTKCFFFFLTIVNRKSFYGLSGYRLGDMATAFCFYFLRVCVVLCVCVHTRVVVVVLFVCVRTRVVEIKNKTKIGKELKTKIYVLKNFELINKNN